MLFQCCLKGTILCCSLLVVILLGACSVLFPVYSVSGQNVEAVRALPANVKVGAFTGQQDSVSCRLQPISPEGGVTFANYIRKALEDEVLIAGASQKGKTVEISGSLVSIDVSCGIIDADWTIEVDIAVNNQPYQRIRTVRNFDGNYVGAIVLQRAYQAFVPTIQKLVYDILKTRQVQMPNLP